MKSGASLSFAAGRIRRGGLAISSAHHQDARSKFMNERYISQVLNSKGIKYWLDDGKWQGHKGNYWQDMLPYYLSKIC
jgi:esterase/lipase superfamily enzyme